MKNVNNFNNFLFDSIIEKVKHDVITLVLSSELYNIIDSIDHPIAKELLKVNGETNFKSKITLLDIDRSNKEKLDNISFTVSSKAIENIISDYNVYINDIDEEFSDYAYRILNDYINTYSENILLLNKNRSVTTLGRIINKVFPDMFKASGEPGQDIESFVNEYKAMMGKDNVFELVNGKDIVYWYNEDQYKPSDSTPLDNSCMKHEECSGYIEFYAANRDKVSLLILKDNKNPDKIRGRALVWNLSEPSDRIFMDRIYYIFQSDVDVFKNYAKERGWIYKNKQSSYDNKLIDSLDNDNDITKVNVHPFNDGPEYQYPYADTLKYYDGVMLSSSSKDIDFSEGRFLEDTEGGSEQVGEYVEHYDEYLNTESDDVKYCPDISSYRYTDDCFYSPYYEKWIDYETSLDNGTNCDYADEDDDSYREYGEYVVLSNGETATNEYAEEHFKYSHYSDCWVEDYVYSNTYNTYLDKNSSVEVFIDLNKTKTDWRDNGDDTYFEAKDGTLYDSKLYDEYKKNEKI